MRLPQHKSRGWWSWQGPPLHDRVRTYSAVTDEPGPAMTVSLSTGKSLPDTVTELKQLDDLGVVDHSIDAKGVVRWHKAKAGIWDWTPPF